MSTVDEAVEAGARAMDDPVADVHHLYRVDPSEWVPYCPCGWKASEPHAVAEYDEHLSVLVIKAAWPFLSAGLRELHLPEPYAQGLDYCEECEHLWPCVTVRELDRIDRELGIGGEA